MVSDREKRRAVMVYGLRNCDSCRKATKWLDEQGIDHSFLDLRADGFDWSALDRWIAATRWELLLNRQSRTWRDLPEVDRLDVGEERARTLMLLHPTLIKRPVIEVGDHVYVSFTPEVQGELTREPQDDPH
jgi:Spx/MgsR family transcriptional regulator